MKRTLWMLLCWALLAGMLAGCAPESHPYTPTGDGLSWDEDSPFQETEPEPTEQETDLLLIYYPDVTMNPYTCTDYTNRTLFSLLYQGLFSVNNQYESTPVLCSNFTVSEDLKQYTFYLEDATFSDGTRMTVNDVYASYLYAMESPVYKGRFLHVKEITVTEDGALQMNMTTAHEDVTILLDIPIVKASELEAVCPRGTGPYFLENNGNQRRLRRVEDWWCREEADLIVNSSAIPLATAESVTQIRDSFEFTDVGLVRANPGSDDYADYRCDYELWDCENGEFLYLGCNLESELFQDVRIRSSLTYAIDRDAIVEEFYRGFAHSATLPASPISPYYNQQLADQYTYDSQRFKDAIVSAGKTGTTIRLLVYKNDTLRVRVARKIAEMLTECGLVVELKLHGFNDYRYFLNIREYDLYLGETQLSPNMDLTPFFSKSGVLRMGGLADTDIYTMCRDALANKGNYYNLHQKIADDGRLCPVLFSTYSVHATRGLLTGLTPARDNVFYYTLGKNTDDVMRLIYDDEQNDQ